MSVKTDVMEVRCSFRTFFSVNLSVNLSGYDGPRSQNYSQEPNRLSFVGFVSRRNAACLDRHELLLLLQFA
jgi:hypothetical protein